MAAWHGNLLLLKEGNKKQEHKHKKQTQQPPANYNHQPFFSFVTPNFNNLRCHTQSSFQHQKLQHRMCKSEQVAKPKNIRSLNDAHSRGSLDSSPGVNAKENWRMPWMQMKRSGVHSTELTMRCVHPSFLVKLRETHLMSRSSMPTNRHVNSLGTVLVRSRWEIRKDWLEDPSLNWWR